MQKMEPFRGNNFFDVFLLCADTPTTDDTISLIEQCYRLVWYIGTLAQEDICHLRLFAVNFSLAKSIDVSLNLRVSQASHYVLPQVTILVKHIQP